MAPEGEVAQGIRVPSRCHQLSLCLSPTDRRDSSASALVIHFRSSRSSVGDYVNSISKWSAMLLLYVRMADSRHLRYHSLV